MMQILSRGYCADMHISDHEQPSEDVYVKLINVKVNWLISTICRNQALLWRTKLVVVDSSYDTDVSCLLTNVS